MIQCIGQKDVGESVKVTARGSVEDEHGRAEEYEIGVHKCSSSDHFSCGYTLICAYRDA